MTTQCLSPRPLRLATVVCLAGTLSLSAATSRVDSLAALQEKINQAAPGDTITVRNGVYTSTEPIIVNTTGADGNPIVIAAETVGGVVIRGSHGFAVSKPAAYIVIKGFKFTHAAGRTTVAGGAHHVRLTRNTFQCVGDGPYLTVTGDDVEVDHNEFRDKHTLGNMINVTGVGSQVARRLHIHWNYFHDFANAHGNGAETIRFGLSGLSMSRGDGLVEHNLFVRCKGENELISNKSCANIYRYNTLLDSEGAQLTLRHGNDCVVYGNYFRNTDGLRIFGDRHLIHHNYFERNSLGINLGNGDGEVADGAKLTSHDRPDDCVIEFNTLLDNAVHYQMNGRKNGLGATRTTFANNVLRGGGVAAKLDGPNRDAAWSGNILWKTSGAGSLPASGYTEKEPQLVKIVDGVWRPLPGGPAIDATACRILTPADVGPDAK